MPTDPAACCGVASPFSTGALWALALSAAGFLGKSVWEYVAERRKGEDGSRREYEFHARAKLYERAEPLLFALRPVLNDTIGHMIGVAREARRDRLIHGDDPWHLKVNDYHVRTFVYRLCMPAVYFRLIEQTVNSFDLGLDPRISRIWRVLGTYTRMFRWDFAFGESIHGADAYDPAKGTDNPMLPDPDSKGPRFRQGIVAGLRDPMLDSFLVTQGETTRAMSFSEFERRFKADTGFRDDLAPLTMIIHRFTPADRPVFWAIALSQLVLALIAHGTLGRAPAALRGDWDAAEEARQELARPEFRAVFRFGGTFAKTEEAIFAAIPTQIASAGRETSIADAAARLSAASA